MLFRSQKQFVPKTAHIANGEKVFMSHCQKCHPGGEAGLGPAINSNPAPMAAFRAQVRGGLGAMPSFPDSVIPGPELDELLAFVSVQRKLTQ